jgi:hypothetical protein
MVRSNVIGSPITRGTMIDFAPLLFDQATARPNGQRGWLLSWRTAADVVEAGAFRTLKV